MKNSSHFNKFADYVLNVNFMSLRRQYIFNGETNFQAVASASIHEDRSSRLNLESVIFISRRFGGKSRPAICGRANAPALCILLYFHLFQSAPSPNFLRGALLSNIARNASPVPRCH